MNQSRFDRGAWLTLAFVLFFSGIVIASTLYTLAQPGDGWQRDLSTVSDIQPLVFYFGNGQTALEVGDRVIRVGALDTSSNMEVFHTDAPAGWRAGATLSYTIVRKEQTIQVPVTVEQPDTAAILRALAHSMQQSAFEWSWALIGLVVFVFRPRNPAARLLLILGVTENVVSKISWAGQTTAFYFTPAVVYYLRSLGDFFWAYLFIPSIILLAQSFPLPTFPFSRFPRLVPVLLYGVPFGFAIAYFWNGDLNLINILLVVEVLLMLGALGGAVYNAWRNSRTPVVRAQVLWTMLGFGLSLGILLPIYLLEVTGVVNPTVFENELGSLLYALPTLALPICLAIAITRYRLFDVSIIIRRTVTYGIVVGLLIVVYFGSIVLLEQVFVTFSGHPSEIITVLSTLAIAALFVPLRNRVQTAIDRRFNRKRYDAQQVLTDFANTVRDETDLEKLTARLVQVVDETMQPASINLWLSRDTQKQKRR